MTGASGYLASALIDELHKNSVRVLRVSRRALPEIPGTQTLRADVRASDCWKEIVSKVDIVFHLAGNTSVYAAAEDPADSLESTVLPMAHLVSAAQAAGRETRVVFASTATVYGLTNGLPVSENAPTTPITNYDLHKLFAEDQLRFATAKGIVRGVSLRLANVFGASPSASSAADRGILNKIARTAMRGGDLKLYGGGEYLRDYVHIDDVVRAFVVAGVETEATGCSFNIASGSGITVRDAFRLIAERAEAATGIKVRIESVPWPADSDPIEFRDFVADVESFHRVTGWRPGTSFGEGVERMISFFANEMMTRQDSE